MYKLIVQLNSHSYNHNDVTQCLQVDHRMMMLGFVLV